METFRLPEGFQSCLSEQILTQFSPSFRLNFKSTSQNGVFLSLKNCRVLS
jgi:hypothetical protein